MALSARLAPTIECDRRAAERRHAGRSRHRATADHATSIAPGPLSSSDRRGRSEEHTSELQSLMRNSYAVFCLKKKKHTTSRHKVQYENVTSIIIYHTLVVTCLLKH